MMNRAYEMNTSCGACAPSARAGFCCARAASMQSSFSGIILILDAIVMASIIIFALPLGVIALLPAAIFSLCLIRGKTKVPRTRALA